MRILINPVEAVLRRPPPGSLDQKKQTASKGNGRTEGWVQEMEKKKFFIDEAQKCWGSERKAKKVKGDIERRGQMGGWPAEITLWVTGQVTVAIDPLIGCLTVSTRLPKPLIRSVS